MQQFEQHNPRNPQSEHQVLKMFVSPQEEDGEDFYFLKQNQHLLVYAERFHTYPETSPFMPGKTELIADQLEMPLEGIRWFVNVIEQKFFKSPEDGGLPAHKISYKETVADEDLHVLRSMNAGCKHPGYKITNASRRSHLSDDDLQGLSLSDPWLFQGRLMDFLKEVADKFERGML